MQTQMVAFNLSGRKRGNFAWVSFLHLIHGNINRPNVAQIAWKHSVMIETTPDKNIFPYPFSVILLLVLLLKILSSRVHANLF